MAHNFYGRVQTLIEETNDAFLSCDGSVNTDYAEFAGMALSDFKAVLRNPSLTRAQLIYMLRRGMAKARYDDPVRWSALMAQQLKKAANRNSGTEKA
ncbi:hypothetical protein N9Z27_01025 [Alphaproteobacteria bacterium]|nr:hypothetical protein [Alphaproteobacteria bacterium]